MIRPSLRAVIKQGTYKIQSDTKNENFWKPQQKLKKFKKKKILTEIEPLQHAF